MKKLIVLMALVSAMGCSSKQSDEWTTIGEPDPIPAPAPIDLKQYDNTSTMNPKAEGYWEEDSQTAKSGEQDLKRLHIVIWDNEGYSVFFCLDRYSRGTVSKLPADNHLEFPVFGAAGGVDKWNAEITQVDDSTLVLNGHIVYHRFTPSSELPMFDPAGDTLCNYQVKGPGEAVVIQ